MKTFKAADKLPKKLKTDQTFKEYVVDKYIEWKFNLERSPWWGGHFERMVRQVKRCLRKVLGNAKTVIRRIIYSPYRNREYFKP